MSETNPKIISYENKKNSISFFHGKLDEHKNTPKKKPNTETEKRKTLKS